MQSNNPMFKKVGFDATYTEPMTVSGAVNKAVLMTGVATAIALVFYFYCLNLGYINSPAMLGAVVGAIGGFVLALIMTFKPHTSSSLALPYAVLEGLFLGGISAAYEYRYPGLPLIAVAATFVTTFGLLGLYKAKIIQATEKFKAVVLSATLAILILYLVQWVMVLAFGNSIPFLFENGMIGLGFAAFVAVIASLNLILDFDLVERSAEYHAPKYMEWFCGVALLATLVWMYISFLRLLGIIRSN
ncbi:Bax inhibitor-1/YccA family protein [Alkanindiges illinoisensis]|uniref:Bax inhibitor-1/YccA family protein n=1 Tax=Alkanindiges illinoisensis TaxID=197183 RepID=A0A4Y7XA18_9GAMM|nr:Bax inhibitor-1/YccA family protein [Alkanindiges illinoisensis]TEU24786.1 Bax inhibitor-1/YccA family protein [Alkanindiges illinoisensis]